MTTKLIRNSTAEFLIFTQQAGEQAIEVRYQDQEIWLTQKLMAQLFDVDVRTINHHLKSIFENKELDENSVIRKYRITAQDGKNYNTQHYNLDAVISVGYRVNSVRAIQFRQWATQILREFALKGYSKKSRGLLLFFALPKKSNQKKGNPERFFFLRLLLTFGTNFPNSLASELKQGKLFSKVYATASAKRRGGSDFTLLCKRSDPMKILQIYKNE